VNLLTHNVYNSLQVVSIFVIVSITFTMQPHFYDGAKQQWPGIGQAGLKFEQGLKSKQGGALNPLTLTTDDRLKCIS